MIIAQREKFVKGFFGESVKFALPRKMGPPCAPEQEAAPFVARPAHRGKAFLGRADHERKGLPWAGFRGAGSSRGEGPAAKRRDGPSTRKGQPCGGRPLGEGQPCGGCPREEGPSLGVSFAGREVRVGEGPRQSDGQAVRGAGSSRGERPAAKWRAGSSQGKASLRALPAGGRAFPWACRSRGEGPVGKAMGRAVREGKASG